LHDWEAQYRVYLLHSLQDPLGPHFYLVLGNLAAAWLVGRERGVLSGTTFYLFVALCHIRDEGAYYVCSYFSLALLAVWAVEASHRASHEIAIGLKNWTEASREGEKASRRASHEAVRGVRQAPRVLAPALVLALTVGFGVQLGR